MLLVRDTVRPESIRGLSHRRSVLIGDSRTLDELRSILVKHRGIRDRPQRSSTLSLISQHALLPSKRLSAAGPVFSADRVKQSDELGSGGVSGTPRRRDRVYPDLSPHCSLSILRASRTSQLPLVFQALSCLYGYCSLRPA